jgi:hypothetical protein
MNIYYLHENPVFAAQMLCDKHVPEMVLETAQILNTVLHHLQAQAGTIYRPTQPAHPCIVWARQSRENYLWVRRHGVALAAEHQLRFKNTHKSAEMILATPLDPPLVESGFTEPHQAVEPIFHVIGDPVAAYRDAYWFAKRRIATWSKGRDAPQWWIQRVEREAEEEHNVTR